MSLTTGLLTGEVDFEEEEAEFDPDADSSSDESADDGGEAPSDHAVLAGAVRLNDEGRVILAGTWSLSSAPDRQVKCATSRQRRGQACSRSARE